MKVIAINGSPKGQSSNTNIMVNAFLAGAEEAGAKTDNIFLAEKNINHCRGCFSCWLNEEKKCVIKDDMEEVLGGLLGVDILVLASPLYFDNISGILKTFMDRSIVGADPHFDKDANGECRHFKLPDVPSPKLVMISNCGFPERSHFQVISHWIKRAALNMHTEVIGEIYATQGGLLSTDIEGLRPVINNYLSYLKKAGQEIAIKMKISEETNKVLEQNFVPEEIYIREANLYFDSLLNK